MNADQFNALYPVGTLVFAYPGFRPEDASDARRLVTRTRTAAQLSASGDPVVWVEGEGSYICLTHVDPVAVDVWEGARAAEKPAVSQEKPTPTRLAPEREAEIDARAGHLYEYSTRHDSEWDVLAGEDVPALLAELATVRAERDQAQARVAELEAERHSTNEALSDAAEALRDMRDRLAEQTRYAALLEAEICQCQPELESGEYMHEATCPVAEIQMRMVGCPGFEDNPVAPNLCAGCHEPREDHEAATNPAEEASR